MKIIIGAQNQQKLTPSLRERWVSWLLTGVLISIGVGIWIAHYFQDPELIRMGQLGADDPFQKSDSNSREKMVLAIPQGLQPVTLPENYDPSNLSDKINGKAELYLIAGVKSLQCRRFALTSDASLWLELYIYDMGSLRNAFAVFSAQRRPKAQPYALTPHAYRSANGLFLVHGRYYLEIIAAQARDVFEPLMQALAEHFIAAMPQQAGTLTELDLFPLQNLIDQSKMLIAANAFGMEGFNWVFTAQYTGADEPLTAFLSQQPSADQARAMAVSYASFLSEFDSQAIEPSPQLIGAHILKVFDSFEIIMIQGPFVIGVHQAVDLQEGIDLAKQLQIKVLEAINGR